MENRKMLDNWGPWRTLARASLAALSLTTLGACAKGIVVGSYPVDNGRHVAPPAFDGNQGAYWSAYVEIEGQDIPRLWKLDGLDYALITAEVSIPTNTGPLVRSVPLFTVEKGMVEYESGVDLLKKMPLHTGARDQVTFKLEITLLDDIAALEAARKILGTVSDLAKPFLDNYPLASKILESSLPLIDEFARPSKKPASSAKTAVVPERLFRDAVRSRNGDVLFAYFLVPRRMIPDTHANDADIRIKSWLRQELGLVDENGQEVLELTECADKHGYLCTTKSTKVFDSLDDSLLEFSHGSTWERFRTGDCPKSAAETFGSYYGKLEDTDVVIKSKLDDAHDLLHANCEAAKHEREPKEADEETGEEAGLTYGDDWQRSMLPYEETSLLYDSFWALAEHLRSQENSTRYMASRVDQVAYVTIKFKRYSEVHDPFMIVNPVGGDCDAVTAQRVGEVEDYLRDNAALFLPEHVDYARSLVAAANDHLALMELADRGAHAQLLDLIATHRVTQVSRPWGWDGGGMLVEPSHALGSWGSPLMAFHEARRGLDECFEQALALPPLAELHALATLYSEKRRERPARLNDLVDALRNVAVVIDDQPPELGASLTGKLSDSPVARALFAEASRLRAEELEEAKNTRCDALAGRLDGYFSATCKECLVELEARCRDELGSELQELRERPSQSPPPARESSVWDRLVGETR